MTYTRPHYSKLTQLITQVSILYYRGYYDGVLYVRAIHGNAVFLAKP
jgi:hypothetical protein